MSGARHQFLLFSGGMLLGFAAFMNVACATSCGEEDCPVPVELASGEFTAINQTEWFEDERAESPLPDLGGATVSVDSEANVVVLRYVDQLGDPVRVTFERRADGGGEGEVEGSR